MARKRPRNTDASDANENSTSKVGNCPHVTKGIDINNIKKSWKKKPDLICQLCKKKSHTSGKNLDTEEKELWICMKCGYIACGNSRKSHGLEHYHTPRSDCHAVFCILDSCTLRCVQCRVDINLDVNGRSSDAVEYVKNYFRSLKEETKYIQSHENIDEIKGNKPSLQQIKYKQLKNVGVSRAFPILGLENIGNTCYMNAILQCLAQTSQLVTELEISVNSEVNFSLPGGRNLIAKEHGEDLPPLLGILGEVGPLTKAVSQLLSRISNGEKLRKTGISHESPAEISRFMKKQANSFFVGEQHDSHELLRVLLESLRVEHMKRYQKGILNSLEICPSTKEVSARDRELVLAYKKQTLLNETPADKTFGGSFVSVLKCMGCGTITTNIEHFMDISLPIEPEKQKPFERGVVVPEKKVSKHQLKKEKKLARRIKKKGHALKVSAEVPLEPVKNHSPSDSSSESGADVEDNIDVENISSSTKDEFKIDQSSGDIQNLNSTLEVLDLTNSESLDFSSSNLYHQNESSGSGRCDVKNDCPAVNSVLVNNNYNSSPEQSKLMALYSPDAFEDFGSCDGGRGSTASSIEQADWDAEHFDSTGDVIQGNEKTFGSSTDEFRSLISDISEDTNYKIIGWDISIEEESLSSFDPYCPIVNSHMDLPSMKISKNSNSDREKKGEEDFSNLDDGKRKTDEISNSIANDQTKGYSDNFIELEMDTELSISDKIGSDFLLKQKSAEDDNSAWSSTLAPLPDINENACSIFNSLQIFFSKEMLSGPNRVGCLHCTKIKNGQEPGANQKLEKADAIKQLLVYKLPSVLTIHFKRFEAVQSRMTKITRKVEFPQELDVSPYTSKKALSVLSGVSMKYQLYGVVEHAGHMTSGHYVAYVKMEHKNDSSIQNEEKRENETKENEDRNLTDKNDINYPQWYLVSDTFIKEVSLKDVLNAEAYLLFYKRC